MTKAKNSVWNIFIKSIQLYFSNFGTFIKYMAFPVLGQFIGILLAFLVAFLYAQNLPKWIISGGILDNFSMIFLLLIIAILPGLLVFAKAFWDYLVAYGAVNSMVDGLLKSGRVYDFPAHNEVITRKTFKYIGLWLVISLLGLVGSFPLFWVIAAIMFVYFVLVFQVFVYEPDKSIIKCFKKSAQMIKGNFWKTVGLMILIGGFTNILLPKLFEFLLGFANLVTYLATPFDIWTRQLPISEFNQMLLGFNLSYTLTSLSLAKTITMGFISFLIVSFTLPLRVICWALWYKRLYKPEAQIDKKLLKRAKRKEN